MPLLILANSPSTDTPYHLWCRDSAREVLLIASTEVAATYGGVVPTLGIADYMDSAAVLAAGDSFLTGKSGASRVVCRGEYDILRAAELRERHGLAGPTAADCAPFRDKHLMKKLVTSSQVRTPRCAEVRSKQEAQAFLARERKIVLKPLTASGAVGTHVVTDVAQLDTLWDTEIEPPVLAEEWIAASGMIHVDGILEDGEILFVHVSRYYNDCLAWRDQKPVGSISLPASHPLHPPAVAALKDVVNHLPKLSTAFHAEFFVVEGRELVFCEIACRSPGARIVQQIRHETGVDLDEVWCLQQLGRLAEARELLARSSAHWSPKESLYAHLLIPPGRGRLARRVPFPLPSWVAESWNKAKVGERYGGAVKSGDWLVSYIVGGDSENALETRLGQLVEMEEEFSTWIEGECA